MRPHGRQGEDQLGADAAVDQCLQGHWPWGAPIVVACSKVPVPVAGGFTFASLAAGQEHTCGLTSGGAVYCWGWIYGNRAWSMTGDLAFTSLSAGVDHTCGVTRAGAAYCWGDNYEGRLGDGSTSNRPTPVRVVDP